MTSICKVMQKMLNSCFDLSRRSCAFSAWKEKMYTDYKNGVLQLKEGNVDVAWDRVPTVSIVHTRVSC